MVTQEPLQSLLSELLSRDIINLKTLMVSVLLLICYLMWRHR